MHLNQLRKLTHEKKTFKYHTQELLQENKVQRDSKVHIVLVIECCKSLQKDLVLKARLNCTKTIILFQQSK